MLSRALRQWSQSGGRALYWKIGFKNAAVVSRPKFSLGSYKFYSNGSNGKTTPSASFKVEDPQMMIAFTCKKCDTRSSHTFSKQSYVKGTVLIQCPGCKNRHLISDNLRIFKDNRFSLEEVLKAKGESVATSTEDLAFSDIPESLRQTIGHHAKDAPEEFKHSSNHDSNEPKPLPTSEDHKHGR